MEMEKPNEACTCNKILFGCEKEKIVTYATKWVRFKSTVSQQISHKCVVSFMSCVSDLQRQKVEWWFSGGYKRGEEESYCLRVCSFSSAS